MKKGLVALMVISAGIQASAFGAVPIRHILLSTNDLNDMGNAPLEGEILYDMVTGAIVAHLNGRDVYLPSTARDPEIVELGAPSQALHASLPLKEMRTVLLSSASI